RGLVHHRDSLAHDIRLRIDHHYTTCMPSSVGIGSSEMSSDDDAPSVSVTRSTRSRSSLPALKCGTCLPGTITCSPDLGLRPMRGERSDNEKLPNPRISMRWPEASAWVIASSMVLTA